MSPPTRDGASPMHRGHAGGFAVRRNWLPRQFGSGLPASHASVAAFPTAISRAQAFR